jgi:capsular polysaccharide biosynthesis protein
MNLAVSDRLRATPEAVDARLRHLVRDRVLRPLLPHVSDAVLGTLEHRLLDDEGLRSTAERTGEYVSYDEPETLELTAPDTDRPLRGRIAERVGTHTLSQPFVCSLPNCKLVGKYPVAVTESGDVPVEAVVRPAVLLRNVVFSAVGAASRPSLPIETLRSDAHLDTACLLYNYWSSGFFHWTFECLTRIEGVERYEAETGRDVTLVLGPDPSEWQLQTLELIGYGESDWVRWSETSATVDRLVVPSVRRETVLSPAAVKWLRGRVRERVQSDAVAPSPDDFPDRIYVSRDDADRRRVANEDAVMDLLGDRGFSRYVLSDLTVAEQAALFAGADVIVAPHGANLTNAIYADDADVVELFREGDVRGQYFQIAEILDFEYQFLVAETDGPNMVVDTDELRSTLPEVATPRREYRNSV